MLLNVVWEYIRCISTYTIQCGVTDSDFFSGIIGQFTCVHIKLLGLSFIFRQFIRNHSIFCFHGYYSVESDRYQPINGLTDLLFGIMGILCDV